MKKNSVKYLQGINFLQLTLAEKSEIKKLGCETPDLVISQLSSSRKQTYVRKFNPAIYEVCPKSIRPWAGKKMFCIWVVTIPNPLQSRPLVTPHT
jgi:hypothetical protein